MGFSKQRGPKHVDLYIYICIHTYVHVCIYTHQNILSKDLKFGPLIFDPGVSVCVWGNYQDQGPLCPR